MPTYLDYSYDDRNSPAYPGVDDTDYAARALAELQAQRNAQAANLGRQDAMINVARGNVPYGTVYTNDGRNGAYRGYSINERGPYANFTGQFMPDPVSGALMYRSLRGFPSAQPHVVPGGPGVPFMYAAPISAAVSATMRDYPIFALNYNPKKAAAAAGGGGGGAPAAKPATPAEETPAAEKPAENAPAAASAEVPAASSTPAATPTNSDVGYFPTSGEALSANNLYISPGDTTNYELDINSDAFKENAAKRLPLFNALADDLRNDVLWENISLEDAYKIQQSRNALENRLAQTAVNVNTNTAYDAGLGAVRSTLNAAQNARQQQAAAINSPNADYLRVR